MAIDFEILEPVSKVPPAARKGNAERYAAILEMQNPPNGGYNAICMKSSRDAINTKQFLGKSGYDAFQRGDKVFFRKNDG